MATALIEFEECEPGDCEKIKNLLMRRANKIVESDRKPSDNDIAIVLAAMMLEAAEA